MKDKALQLVIPNGGIILCPECSSSDVRYSRDEGCWRCKQCPAKFRAKGERDGIRLETKKPRRGHAEAAN